MEKPKGNTALKNKLNSLAKVHVEFCYFRKRFARNFKFPEKWRLFNEYYCIVSCVFVWQRILDSKMTMEWKFCRVQWSFIFADVKDTEALLATVSPHDHRTFWALLKRQRARSEFLRGHVQAWIFQVFLAAAWVALKRQQGSYPFISIRSSHARISCIHNIYTDLTHQNYTKWDTRWNLLTYG